MTENAVTQSGNDTPSINWGVAATHISKDSGRGNLSAFLILEEIQFSRDFFDSAKSDFKASTKAFEFACVLDWKWPVDVSSRENVEFRIVWVTPSGKRFGGEGDVREVARPTVRNRSQVHVHLEGVPVQEEGIYVIEVVLNRVVKYRYPIRIRCEGDEDSEVASPRRSARKIPTSKPKIAKTS
jgi:hypothetical protein